MVMTLALVTTNPLYLGVILLGVVLVAVLAPRTATGVTSFRALAIFGVTMLVISVAVATINGNYGEHILFTVPGPEVPAWLGGLRLGGPVSAEGLAAAAIRGLAILSILLAFGVFNGAVSPQRVLRSTPAALFQASLVVTVGLTLLPATIEDLRRVREMRALRGAGGGLRDLPSLVVPAVIGGLERSMRLAEAMEARGYGAAPALPTRARLMAAASAPLFIAAAWGWFYGPGWRPSAALAAAVGVACLGYWWRTAARLHHTTRLNDEPLAAGDRAAVAFAVGVAGLAVGARLAGVGTLSYNPFAGLAAPGFSVGGALLAMAAAWPALPLAFGERPVSANEPEPLVAEVAP
jgi:energy-coupling factor transport system permease protein